MKRKIKEKNYSLHYNLLFYKSLKLILSFSGLNTLVFLEFSLYIQKIYKKNFKKVVIFQNRCVIMY